MSCDPNDPLGQEHAQLRKDARRQRRDVVATTLGAIVMRAVKEAEDLRAQGADAAAVASGLEAVIREHWPKGRPEDWRYLCAECDDYGRRVFSCPGDASCGRTFRHGPHAYVEPCWCAKGQALKAKPKTTVDELAAVGKTQKPTRFGR
jgi:hypothetical protein